jgi:predicted kinase
MIIIVFGLPGSGKTFFATRLAKKLGAGYLSSDELRKDLFPVRTYSLSEKMAVYEEMQMAAREAIKNGIDLVLDGSFFKESIRKKFWDYIEKEQQSMFFIEVVAEEPVIRERLSKPRAFSEADFEVYKKIRSQWEPMREDHLIVSSTNENEQEMLSKAEDYLLIHHGSNRH